MIRACCARVRKFMWGSVDTCLSQCAYGGQRVASEAGPHLPPCSILCMLCTLAGLRGSRESLSLTPVSLQVPGFQTEHTTAPGFSRDSNLGFHACMGNIYRVCLGSLLESKQTLVPKGEAGCRHQACLSSLVPHL